MTVAQVKVILFLLCSLLIDPLGGDPLNPSKSDDDIQKVYDILPRTEDVFNLNYRDLELASKLGLLTTSIEFLPPQALLMLRCIYQEYKQYMY